MRFFAGFDQVSYVTNDMARATEIMQKDYGLPAFNTRDLEFPGTVGDLSGSIHIVVAVTAFDGMKVELIQPISDLGDLYSHRLAPDREAGLAFHHLGVRVRGDDRELWDERLAELRQRGNVYFTGDLSPDIQFAYTDERAVLGHFVEHYWVKGQP